MSWIRNTTIFQLTTNPTDLTRAIPHTGGWSETIWYNDSSDAGDLRIADVRQARRLISPKVVGIVGFRRARYDLTNGVLLPAGARSAGLNLNGNMRYETDLPQVSLQIDYRTGATINTSRQMLRGMPDEIMSSGEYQPDPVFARLMTSYINSIITAACFFFPGRDLSKPRARVMGLAGAVLTVDAVPAGVVANAMIRFLHCRDSNGNPVKGSFRVLNVVGLDITLATAPGGAITKPNGFIRQDALDFFPYSTGTPTRARVKKIGRPSQGYRGRRSKARV